MAGTLIPLGDRVIVKRDEAVSKTKGGILLVKDSLERPQEGTVVLVGPGRITDHGELIPMAVEKGQRVMFAKWQDYGHKENVMVREADIIGIYA
jgi:chaperonin GroES